MKWIIKRSLTNSISWDIKQKVSLKGVNDLQNPHDVYMHTCISTS